jgi:hypothetical protein
MERIDRKFTFSGICTEHRAAHAVSHMDAVVFLARDRALVPTLHFYQTRCQQLGADPRQVEGIRLLIARVERWQAEHPEELKVPDVDNTPEGLAIVAPNEAPGVPS